MRYFDYAATTPTDHDVLTLMHEVAKAYPGNPSSLHDPGIAARKRYNQAKNAVAEQLNTTRKNLIFTGNGSEANNLAIKGFYHRHPDARIITTAVEHKATLSTCLYLKDKGADVVVLPVSSEGNLDLDALKNVLEKDKNHFLTLIYANNETGSLLNWEPIKAILAPYQVTVHLDMIQAPLYEVIDLDTLGADMVSLSGHKFHGPRGVGLLYVRDAERIDSLIHGGTHEFKKRAGTENLPAICGFALALKEAQANAEAHAKETTRLAKRLLERLYRRGIDYRLNGQPLNANRIDAILNIGFAGVDADVLAFELNRLGFYVSLGSACDAGNIEPSHVLQAMNVPSPYLEGSIRISLGKNLSSEDIDALADALGNLAT